jgi:hypothetical protein
MSKKIDLTNPERLDLFLKQAAEIHNRIAEAVAVVNKLTVSIDKLATEIQNLTARLAIERRAPPPAAPTRKMSKCGSATFRGCGADIYWEDRKPFNPDGSAHRCQTGGGKA